jgi:hypothetical protein
MRTFDGVEREAADNSKMMPKFGFKNKFKKVRVLKGMKMNPRFEGDKGASTFRPKSRLERPGDKKRCIVLDKRLKNWKNKVSFLNF